MLSMFLDSTKGRKLPSNEQNFKVGGTGRSGGKRKAAEVGLIAAAFKQSGISGPLHSLALAHIAREISATGAVRVKCGSLLYR
ncbi:hypothetical protein EI42_00036 [Thermosporothrix hazakensis]|uniref:Uncharacterized protein n=1 Tax=Thermosporothrix hazakensis TaxID=644383 RepID=A0A326UT33_THEHA|nr:hypothetical protein EI42_00036 [Thermosporothrix hazakensis]